MSDNIYIFTTGLIGGIYCKYIKIKIMVPNIDRDSIYKYLCLSLCSNKKDLINKLLI